MTRSSNYNNHQLSAVSLANSLTTIKHTEDNETSWWKWCLMPLSTIS